MTTLYVLGWTSLVLFKAFTAHERAIGRLARDFLASQQATKNFVDVIIQSDWQCECDK
jgi:hypothetical protein